MTDDLLARLDESLGAVREGLVPAPAGARHRGAAAAALRAIEAPAPVARASIRDRWPWVEWFVCAQFLWGALLFIPGAQAYRPIIRALPYASSIGMLLLYLPQRSTWTKAPGSAAFMLAALGVLVANLLHPTTQFAAGVAQCVFQLMIAAPVFWAWKAVRDETRLLQGHTPGVRVERPECLGRSVAGLSAGCVPAAAVQRARHAALEHVGGRALVRRGRRPDDCAAARAHGPARGRVGCRRDQRGAGAGADAAYRGAPRTAFSVSAALGWDSSCSTSRRSGRCC